MTDARSLLRELLDAPSDLFERDQVYNRDLRARCERILAIEAQAAQSDTLLGNQHDLADAICFLDGHERPEADCHCDGCADFAEAAVVCLSARAAALAAPVEEKP